MAEVSGSAAPSVDRVHVVLVPGFAGFDALGQIEYYAGTTDRFARWSGSGGPGEQTAVLHYFDNLPTAGVATRAERLRTYLATRIARREKIADTTFPPQLAALCDDVAKLNDSLFDDAKLSPSGPRYGQPLEVWDNDGIVNTASMLWPNGGDTRLVAADHLDIVGHFMRHPAAPSDDSGRVYASVDALKSHTEFTQEEFDRVWKAVFDFCVS